MLNKNIMAKEPVMKKYEEEHYLYDNIKDQIYPWVSSTLSLPETLNGKNISEKDTPLIEFVGALKIPPFPIMTYLPRLVHPLPGLLLNFGWAAVFPLPLPCMQ